MNDFVDTIPTEWAASAATEIGADQSDRVEPGMQMLGWLITAAIAIGSVFAVVA